MRGAAVDRSRPGGGRAGGRGIRVLQDRARRGLRRRSPSPLRSIEIVGPEQTVFDWSRDSCEPRDIPDAPARAFRDARGRVQLIASHYVNRREVGPDLDHLAHRCEVIMRSGYDPLPQ